MKEWNQKNADPERQRAYHKVYYAENAEQIIEKTKAYKRTERGKETVRKAYQNQKLRNGKKVAARQIVRMAIVGGILTKKPCEKCGALKVQAHHEDYDKPLEVVWLCQPDHRKRHLEMDKDWYARTRDQAGKFTEIPTSA